MSYFSSVKGHVRTTFSNGIWSPPQVVNHNNVTLNCLSVGLGYAQACFEGMRAHRMKDGKIRVVTPRENYIRFVRSCSYVSIVPPPEFLFYKMIRTAIEPCTQSLAEAPPGASLYVRPMIFGTLPSVKVKGSEEFNMVVACCLFGKYPLSSSTDPSKAVILGMRDRAAVYGTGQAKLTSNYPYTMTLAKEAEEKGYNLVLFLDPGSNTYIEEFSTSNFVGIIPPKGPGDVPTYVTPRSQSILEGVVNKNLAKLASMKFGWKIENRRISWEELASGKFSEVAAVGTSIVVAPVESITREYCDPNTEEYVAPVYGRVEQPVINRGKPIRLEKISISGTEKRFPLITKLREAYLDVCNGVDEDWASYGIMDDLSEW